ncbi:hypothetical protein RSAG8_03054, partial [Rhizoctonia solani AG-8 WAC10335]
MRFLSIAALTGLLTTSVYAHTAENQDHASHLEGPWVASPAAKLAQRVRVRGCQDCSPGSFSLGGISRCQTCPTGSSSNSCESSCVCKPGFYSGSGRTTGDACNSCPAGYISGSGARDCQKCSANTYANGGNCTPCAPGYGSDAGATSCTPKCRAGLAGAASCSDCPDDTYSSPGASSCAQCPTGKGCGSRSTSINQCIDKCPDGKVYSGGRCQNCPAGTYSNNNMCSDCPPGTISNPGSKSCTACPGGSVPSSNNQSCSTCPRNTFSNGDNCPPCPAGSTSNPGSSSCGPQPSKRAQPVLASRLSCPTGQQSCPILSGMGGEECIKIMTTIDSCGGCVGPEGDEDEKYTGRDCYAIAHVREVGCNEGRCQVKSCLDGYEPSGESCIEKAAYTGKNGASKNGTSHSNRAKRGFLSRHDTF